MTNDYQPVACSLHSEYELLAMHRETVALECNDTQLPHTLTGMVIDLVTRDGAEYLCLDTDNGMQQVRLDRIQRLTRTGN
ncbi:MAG: Rho-binding antiterminator [Chromatiales bacterium]|jgi:transcriptional antiterminator Rof (Rho-off)